MTCILDDYTTRTSMFSHALSFYKYTQVNTMLYDLGVMLAGLVRLGFG